MLEDPLPISEILVPMDFSASAKLALQFAKRVAFSSGARLHLLFVDDDPMLVDSRTDQVFREQHAEPFLAKFADLLSQQDREQFRPITEVRWGTAYHEIETYAAETQIDLIVMGNVGRSAVSEALLGSVSAHVIRHAACPVLSVRTPRKKSRRSTD